MKVFSNDPSDQLSQFLLRPPVWKRTHLTHVHTPHTRAHASHMHTSHGPVTLPLSSLDSLSGPFPAVSPRGRGAQHQLTKDLKASSPQLLQSQENKESLPRFPSALASPGAKAGHACPDPSPSGWVQSSSLRKAGPRVSNGQEAGAGASV